MTATREAKASTAYWRRLRLLALSFTFDARAGQVANPLCRGGELAGPLTAQHSSTAIRNLWHITHAYYR